MDPNENPHIKPTDYFKEYNKNIDSLKNHPKAIEFDKICYELFHVNPQGIEFIKVCKEKFLMPALAQVGNPTFQIDCIWAEGFKEAFRTIIKAANAHDQRIKAEMNKQ